MKVTLKFSELQKVLSYTDAILSDKSSDKAKNVIFSVKGNDVNIIGDNEFTTSRTHMEYAEVEDIPDEGWLFQIKSADLNKLVSSFSNMARTYVDVIDIKNNNNKLLITVHEIPKEGEDENYAKDAYFNSDILPLPAKIEERVQTQFPEEYVTIDTETLMVYLKAFSSLLTNDVSGTSSKLSFAEDYVFFTSQDMSAFMLNRLPDQLKDVMLTYSTVMFIRKICDKTSTIDVARTPSSICIRAENTCAFAKYSRVTYNYKIFISKKSTDKGFMIDKMYLGDILKRMENSMPNGIMKIVNDSTLVVTNDVYNQEIPLLKVKGDVTGTEFKISVPTFKKLLIGDDTYPNNLFVYLVDTMRGYVVYVQDESDAWFASAQLLKTK